MDLKSLFSGDRTLVVACALGIVSSFMIPFLLPSRQHQAVKYGKPLPGSNPPDITHIVGGPSEHSAGELHASHDGQVYIFTRRWEPKGQCRATLMLLHGTVDHSGQYEELARHLATQGIAVFAPDMRGWGLSDGDTMYLENMESLIADVKAEYERIHAQERYQMVRKRFILGKSIGGLIAAETVIHHPSLFNGLIGLSGAFKVDHNTLPPPIVMMILRGVHAILPKLPIKHIVPKELIVSEAAALVEWEKDPLASKEKVKLGYIMTGNDALGHLEKNHHKITCSVLMLWGTGDKIVTRDGHTMMTLGPGDKEMKTYDGGFHNLLLEPKHKAKVMQDISSWILMRS